MRVALISSVVVFVFLWGPAGRLVMFVRDWYRLTKSYATGRDRLVAGGYKVGEPITKLEPDGRRGIYAEVEPPEGKPQGMRGMVRMG